MTKNMTTTNNETRTHIHHLHNFMETKRIMKRRPSFIPKKIIIHSHNNNANIEPNTGMTIRTIFHMLFFDFPVF